MGGAATHTGRRELDGQVAVVTGGGSGVGRGIALELAAAGAHVVVAGRRSGPLDETVDLVRAAGGSGSAVSADVTDPEQVEALFARAAGDHGRLDLLVNDAGRLRAVGPSWEVDEASWWEDVTVNLRGVYLCCRAALPRMLARGRGRIVNLASGAGLGPRPYATAYGASKAAVIHYTESLHHEVQERGLAVYAINPGFVVTEMTRRNIESPEGQRYLPARRAYESGRAVSPALAGQLCVFLATLPAPTAQQLGGRVLSTADEYRAIAAKADEVSRGGLYTLRRAELRRS